MTNLGKIAENIKNKNFEKALELCEAIIEKKNQHFIYNFKGVIYLIQKNLDLSEKNFLRSIEIDQRTFILCKKTC